MEKRVIGRGTWIDKVAARIIEREKYLGRGLSMIRTESGLGASGIPHLGSMSDAVRAHAVALALRDMGYGSEMIAFSDDMDGLRKVPEGMPNWLNDYLLIPVNRIPDPFGNYESYAERMTRMLLEALDEAGIEYVYRSGREVYASGLMKDIIHTILLNAARIGEKIKSTLGQEKFTRVLPYFPICKGCGRIYTATADSYDESKGVVHYRCVGVNVRGRNFEGCGYEGEADIARDDGKLAWKVEFAARWALLDIRFEAYGKDIADSVRINDWVSKNILNYEPPLHVRYEMFLDSLGRKISKSSGNVFTPQTWYRYGTPQSLILLMLKRSVGTRHISPSTIPRLMDELDRIEDVYFGRQRVENFFEERKLKGLYEYCHNLRPPSSPSTHIPYRLLIELAKYSPQKFKEEFIASRLKKYGYTVDDSVKVRIRLAINYADDFGEIGVAKDVDLTEQEKRCIEAIVERLASVSSPEEVQSSIFEISRCMGLRPQDVFRKFYQILLGQPSGPRLGPYLFDLGYEAVKSIVGPHLKR